jgi:anti-sigma factor RsiW
MTLLLDEELAETGRREVEEHLASCADCREEMAELRVMRAAWRSAGPILRSTADERAAVVTAAAPYFPGGRARAGRRPWWASMRPGDWLTVGAAAAAAVFAVLLAEERRALRIYETWPSSSTVLTAAEMEARERGVRIETRESVPIVDPLGSGSRESGVGRSS